MYKDSNWMFSRSIWSIYSIPAQCAKYSKWSWYLVSTSILYFTLCIITLNCRSLCLLTVPQLSQMIQINFFLSLTRDATLYSIQRILEFKRHACAIWFYVCYALLWHRIARESIAIFNHENLYILCNRGLLCWNYGAELYQIFS